MKQKLFLGAAILVAILGIIPFVVNTQINSLTALVSELFYYSPFLTPVLIATIALLSGKTGPVVGLVGALLIIVAIPALWLLYSISFGDTSSEYGIAFLGYSFINIPFLIGALIGIPLSIIKRQ